jgi:hypothetical protein
MNRLLPLATLLSSTLALATSPEPKPEAQTPTQVSAEQVVQAKVLKPLAARELERSRFSRARLPPQARRVRVIDAEAKKDSGGAAFVAFAVDARHGFDLEDEDGLPRKADGAWRKDTITGCVYVESGAVFVKRGEEFRPAEVLLGKKTKPSASHVCKGADAELARK